MTNPSRRSFLRLSAAALGAVAFAAETLAQATRDERMTRRRRGRADDGAYQPTYAGRCRPMCDNDTSPCDSPSEKAADGRCSNPTGSIY